MTAQSAKSAPAKAPVKATAPVQSAKSATPAKKKRNSGPFMLNFADKAGKSDYKRPPADVTSVIITSRKDNSKRTYDLSKIPPTVTMALLALAVGTRQKTYINNHVEDDGSNVHTLSDGVWADFLAGKVYSRTESTGGAPRGRKFDATRVVNCVVNGFIAMAKANMTKPNGEPIKPMTDKQINDLTVKLNTLSGQERNEQLRKFKKNPFIKLEFARLEGSKATTKEVDVDDMF